MTLVLVRSFQVAVLNFKINFYVQHGGSANKIWLREGFRDICLGSKGFRIEKKVEKHWCNLSLIKCLYNTPCYQQIQQLSISLLQNEMSHFSCITLCRRKHFLWMFGIIRHLLHYHVNCHWFNVSLSFKNICIACKNRYNS